MERPFQLQHGLFERVLLLICNGLTQETCDTPDAFILEKNQDILTSRYNITTLAQ